MGEVIDFPGWTKIPIEPDKVLQGAIGKFEQVLVLGIDKDDNVIACSSTPDAKEWLFVCGQFQHKLFRGDFG